MSSEAPPKFWSVGEDIQPSPLPQASLWNSELWATVEEEIDALDVGLRELSLDIHGRLIRRRNNDETETTCSPPRATIRREVRCWSVRPVQGVPDHSSPNPRHAHDVLTDYVAKQGFEVKKNHVLPTGWEAKFSYGSGGRTIGVNSGNQHPLSDPLSITSHRTYRDGRASWRRSCMWPQSHCNFRSCRRMCHQEGYRKAQHLRYRDSPRNSWWVLSRSGIHICH